MSDRIAVFNAGRIEQVGTADRGLRATRRRRSSPASSAPRTCSTATAAVQLFGQPGTCDLRPGADAGRRAGRRRRRRTSARSTARSPRSSTPASATRLLVDLDAGRPSLVATAAATWPRPRPGWTTGSAVRCVSCWRREHERRVRRRHERTASHDPPEVVMSATASLRSRRHGRHLRPGRSPRCGVVHHGAPAPAASATRVSPRPKVAMPSASGRRGRGQHRRLGRLRRGRLQRPEGRLGHAVREGRPAARSTSRAPTPPTRWSRLMKTGQYDVVSASGDASLRLIAAGDVGAGQHRPGAQLRGRLRRPEDQAVELGQRRSPTASRTAGAPTC